MNSIEPVGDSSTRPELESASVRVLVVEDEPNIRELVCLHLGLEGYSCEGVGDGNAALKRVEAERFDLLVLDLMLPGLDGLTLTREVRSGGLNFDVPIMVLTALRDESERVVGLESGADDYLTKPFGVRELVARARALLRRPRHRASAAGPASPHPAALAPSTSSKPVQVRDIEIDPARRRVRVAGRDVGLTDQEFRLLHWLARHPGIVFSREMLLSTIWRGDTFVTVRSVDTLVKRLRRRIESDPADPRYLLTVWGVGYKLIDP